MVRNTTQNVRLDEPSVPHNVHNPILKVQVHRIMVGMMRIMITS
jgi:hypothetical protein